MSRGCAVRGVEKRGDLPTWGDLPNGGPTRRCLRRSVALSGVGGDRLAGIDLAAPRYVPLSVAPARRSNARRAGAAGDAVCGRDATAAVLRSRTWRAGGYRDRPA